MHAKALFVNLPDAANDSDYGFPPVTLARSAAVDPAVRAWAEDFDAWLETPEGEKWLSQMEEVASYPADAFEVTDAYA